MESKFNRGDIVKLKSGGPYLVVCKYSSVTDMVKVVYFNKNDDLQYEEIAEDLLQFVKKDLERTEVTKPKLGPRHIQK